MLAIVNKFLQWNKLKLKISRVFELRVQIALVALNYKVKLLSLLNPELTPKNNGSFRELNHLE